MCATFCCICNKSWAKQVHGHKAFWFYGKEHFQETFRVGSCGWWESGRGLPQSKTLSRQCETCRSSWPQCALNFWEKEAFQEAFHVGAGLRRLVVGCTLIQVKVTLPMACDKQRDKLKARAQMTVIATFQVNP